MASRDREAPDLFAAGSDAHQRTENSVREAMPSDRPYLLPGDLPKALAWLSSDELDALEVAVGVEKRRRLATDAGAAGVAERTGKPSVMKRPSAARTTSPPAPPMTRVKANAVRAAFKAGVKPSVLARQFGVSLAAIRKVLSGSGG